jgi:DNA-binding transcriptional MocR family regulator
MKPILLDRSSETPLFRQIAEQVAGQIRDGDCPAGVRLPPTRRLVELLGINRGTAVAAYESLEREGLVRTRVGSGTEVTGPASPGAAGISGWDGALTPGLRRLAGRAEAETFEPIPDHVVADFSRLAPDSGLFPVEPLRRALDAVLRRGGADLLQYGSGQGLLPLRETIASRMESRGIPTSPAEVLVVSGAQQGLDLLLRAFAAPSGRVAVETPTYTGILPLLRLGGIEAVPIPMTPEGISVEGLERAAASNRFEFVYTIPTLQNPTGVTSSRLQRERLLAAAERHGFLVVEDGYENDLEAGRKVPPLASLGGGRKRVLYLGSFSKGLFPGARVGWIAGDADAIRRLSNLKRAVDYGAPPLLQAAIDRLARSGEYDRHLASLDQVFRLRRRSLKRALERHLPAGCRFDLPDGALAAWVTLPPGTSSDAVAREAASLGVLVSPASRFLPPGAPPVEALRISLCRVQGAPLERGIQLLGGVLSRALAPNDRHARWGEDEPTL